MKLYAVCVMARPEIDGKMYASYMNGWCAKAIQPVNLPRPHRSDTFP